VVTKRTLKWTAVVVAIALAGGGAYMYAVREGWIRYNKYDRREKGSIKVGDPAPDLALVAYDGSPVRLAGLWAEKPLVLVFGSCT
jgi:hypothetical protein